MNERDVILDGLKPLFEKADREGWWFYSNYQQLWFSPLELREAHKEERFLWGATNWELRSPEELMDALIARRNGVDKEIEKLTTRLALEIASKSIKS